MRAVFTVDYDDGTYRKKAGDTVPASMPEHKRKRLLKAGLAKEAPLPSRKKAKK